MKNINDFKNIFKRGLYSANRFEININHIKNLYVPELIRYSIQNIPIEHITNEVIKQQFFATPVKIVGSVKTEGAIQITVLLDGDGVSLKFWEDWLSLPFSKERGQLKYKEDYISNVVEISTFNKRGKNISKFKYHNCFPSKIDPVVLDMSESGKTIAVITLEYENMTVEQSISSNEYKAISSNSNILKNNQNIELGYKTTLEEDIKKYNMVVNGFETSNVDIGKIL